mgnify:CR=1 FL=1
MSLLGFIAQYPDKNSCNRKLKSMRDKDEIVCNCCGGKDPYWKINRWQFECKTCKKCTTLKSGIVLHGSLIPWAPLEVSNLKRKLLAIHNKIKTEYFQGSLIELCYSLKRIYFGKVLIDRLKIAKVTPKKFAFVLLLFTITACHNKGTFQNKIIPSHIQTIVHSNNVVFHSPVDKKKHENLHARGMPLGNGSFGGVLYTNQSELSMQLNHTDFWRYDSTTKSFPQYGARPFGLGNLKINWGMNDSMEYFQELDLYKAMVITHLSKGNQKAIIHSFFDANDDVAVFQFDLSDYNNIDSFFISMGCWRKQTLGYINNEMGILYEPPKPARSFDEIAYLQKLSDNKYDTLFSSYALAIKVIDGKNIGMSSDDSGIIIKALPDQNRVLTIAIATDVVEFTTKPIDPRKRVKELMSRKGKEGVDKIKASHFQWWENYWNKSYIILESEDSLAGMMENLWYLHNYLMASTYRGKYPGKFNYSLWITAGDERDWGGGYWHFNQSPEHLAATAANHPEFSANYYKMIHENLDRIKKQTKEIWGHEGAFLHETHTPEGLSYKYNRDQIYEENTLWTGLLFSTGLECAYQMYQYALYTGNDQYMREKVFPFMKEAALFYVHHMKRDSSGIYYLYPANAHENLWRVKNPHTDLAAIKRCFPILLDMFSKYEINSKEKESIKDLLENLSPLPTGKYIRDYNVSVGRSIIGFDPDVDIFAPGIIVEDSILHNRHTIDTYSSYPFELTTVGHPQYKRAVRTLRNRFFPKVEYALTKPMMAAAVLQLPEDTRELCDQYMRVLELSEGGITWPEMPANLSITLNSMLLHSYDSVIRICPSLPNNWNASYKLLAMGPSIVYATCKNGEVTFLEIECLKDQVINVENPWGNKAIVLKGSEEILYSDGILSWQAKKSEIYSLYPEGKKFNSMKQDTFSLRQRNKTPKTYKNQCLGN